MFQLKTTEKTTKNKHQRLHVPYITLSQLRRANIIFMIFQPLKSSVTRSKK